MQTIARTTPVAAPDVARAICSYAARFHASVDDGHHVASPLGAWMLLALCGSSTDGKLRDEVTAALGIDVDTAAAFAATLLAAPHPAIGSGAAIWTRPGLSAEGMARWLAQLPVGTERGDLPSQSALDAWAKERTGGLIECFPATVDSRTLFVLATVLATKVTWDEPFGVARGKRLGRRSAWSGLSRVLAAFAQRGHSPLIVATERAGDVAVHTATAKEGVSVTAVIAPRDVAPSDVLAVAHELAVAAATGGEISRRSLFDLAVGDSALWTIEEYEVEVSGGGDRFEWCSSVLPAWSADSVHDLGRSTLGFPAAAAALGALTEETEVAYSASQAAAARYSRKGFEAAAITGLLAAAGAAANPRRGTPVPVRHAELRFGHPFAVVAVSTDTRWRRGPVAGRNPWYGLPLFSAWVTEPSEAEEEEFDYVMWEGEEDEDAAP